jgi:hypothetical protein
MISELKAASGTFPLLGKWKVLYRKNESGVISEPIQEIEFLPDRTCIYVRMNSKMNRPIRFTGSYSFIQPDHFSTVSKDKSGATQKFIITGKQVETYANGITSFLKNIKETEFVETPIDA